MERRRGDGEVESVELGEQIGFRIEAVGREGGGGERGVGSFQRVRVGEFERAVEGAQFAF
jgi:hypothetical protein